MAVSGELFCVSDHNTPYIAAKKSNPDNSTQEIMVPCNRIIAALPPIFTRQQPRR